MMKKIFWLLGVFILSVKCYAQSDTLTLLEPVQFNRIAHLNPNAVVIDVRQKKDFKKGHIAHALLADTSDKLFAILDSLGKEKVYLLYCKYGERSHAAGKLIYEKYGMKVCSLSDGLDAWREEGLELEK